MSVLLYAPVSKPIRERYQHEIEKLVPREEVETYRTKEDLSSRLRLPRKDIALAVLIATNKKKFLEIFSLCELLGDLRIILLLPDRKEDTIFKGHILRPRFLGYADSDLKMVAPVLNNMLSVGIESGNLPERSGDPGWVKKESVNAGADLVNSHSAKVT